MGADAAEAIAAGLQPLVEEIRNHPLYRHVRDARSLRTLMSSHVFAVWDFQSLLKALQRLLTCVDVPWLPTADPEARRFVNEIVLDEESDAAPGGGYLSHFELYRQAMSECGADAAPIDRFLAALREGQDATSALAAAGVSEAVAAFVETTMDVVERGKPHEIAAAFSFGREDIIPEMFQQLVDNLASGEPQTWSTFQYYLVRHISNDGERHGPMSRRIVTSLCGDDRQKISEAQAVAARCLQARLRLWHDVLRQITAGT